jgi:hypothetical protein
VGTKTTECLPLITKARSDTTMALLEPGGEPAGEKAKKRDDEERPKNEMRERHRRYVSEHAPTPRQVVPQWGSSAAADLVVGRRVLGTLIGRARTMGQMDSTWSSGEPGQGGARAFSRGGLK